MEDKRTMLLAAIAVALLFGWLTSVALEAAAGKGFAAWGSVERGCLPEAGTSKPFPGTGLIALEKVDAAAAARARKAALGASSEKALAAGNVADVWVVNEGEGAASALLMDEDGAPRARVFARSGEVAKIRVAPGAYTVAVSFGSDWDGEKFASSCALKSLATGIAVAERDAASLVMLYSERGFVMGNRMSMAVADELVDKASGVRKSSQAPGDAVGAARPEREQRP